MKGTLALLLLGLMGWSRPSVAQPRIVVDPPGVEFGAVLCQATAKRTLAVSNPGNATLTVSRASVIDPYRRDPSPWSLADDRFTVAPGATHDLSIEFHPTEVGSFAVELELLGDDPQARSTRVALDGRGVEASWSVSPPSLSFRSLLVGDASAPQQITLANRGLVAVQVFPPRLEGPGADQFRVAAAGATTLLPGQSEAYALVCVPSSPGTHFAQLVLSAGGTMAPVVVPLAATAVATTLANPTVDWSFGDVPVGTSSAPRDFAVALEPPGLGGRLLAVASSNPSFVLDTAATRWSLDPGETTSTSVRFVPAAAGEVTAQLTVVAAGELGPLLVARLHGRGVAMPPIVAAEACSTGGRTPTGIDLSLPLVLLLLVRRRRAAD